MFFVKSGVMVLLFAFFSGCLASGFDFEVFSRSYDLLTAVAGKGGSGDGDLNEWRPEYEGGPAVDAVLSGPHMAMADSAGNVYIADKNAHAVRKVAPDGTITTLAGTNSPGNGGNGRAVEQALNGPNGLWVDRRGRCYILDLGNGKIRVVDPGGEMETLVHDTGGISLGRGLWVSGGEDTVWYSSGTRIRMWTATGGIVTFAEGFAALGNIVQDPAGALVATDRSAGLVYRIDRQGAKTIIAGDGSEEGGGEGFGALETAFHGVRGVWFLDDGSYFLATHEGSRIWYIDPDGIVHLFLDGLEGDGHHSGDGENYRTPGFKISEARAVTVDYMGNVLVTENDRGFVRMIAKADAAVLTGRAARSDFMMNVHSRGPGAFAIRYTTVRRETVELHVFDNGGRSVATLFRGMMPAGTHEALWRSENAAAGLYIAILRSNSGFFVRPVHLVR